MNIAVLWQSSKSVGFARNIPRNFTRQVRKMKFSNDFPKGNHKLSQSFMTESPQFWSEDITKYVFHSPFLNVFHPPKPAILAVGRDTWSHYEYWLVAHAMMQMSQLIHTRRYQTRYSEGYSCLVILQFCGDLQFAKHAEEIQHFHVVLDIDVGHK